MPNGPDLVTGAFKHKVDESMNEILKKHTYVLEFNRINQVISVEIPPVQSTIYSFMKKHMIHNPCLHINNKAACLKEERCSNKFPDPLI